MTEPVVWFDDAACRDVACRRRQGREPRGDGRRGAERPARVRRSRRRARASRVDAEALRALRRATRLRTAHRARPRRRARRGARSAAPTSALGGAVAVRSSACAEDSEEASFAGQQETFLEVEGADEVCDRVVECWASFFSERALFYRSQKGSLDDLEMAVVVQTMVDAGEVGRPLHRRSRRSGGATGCSSRRSTGSASRSSPARSPRITTSPTARARSRRERLVARRRAHARRAPRRSPRLGASLEERFGVPQDVEWAIADGDAVPAPVAAGDDAVTRPSADAWIEPYWNADHLRRTRDWLLVLEPDAGEALQLAALTHDMERHFPGGPRSDLRRSRRRPTRTTGESTRSARRGSSASGCAAEGAPTTTIADGRAARSRSTRSAETATQTSSRRPTRCRSSRSTSTCPTPGHGEATARWSEPARSTRGCSSASRCRRRGARRAALRGGAPAWQLTGWPRPRSRRRSRSGQSTETTPPSSPEERFSRSSSTSGYRPLEAARSAERPGTRRDPGRRRARGSERSSRTARSSAPRSYASGWPALAHVFSVVASPRIRNQATVGGVLGDADYASDPPAMLVALGARVVAQSARGARELPVEKLIVGHYETSLEADELITESSSRAAPTAPSTGSSALARTRTARASASRRAATADGLRVVVGAVAGTPQFFPEVCRLDRPGGDRPRLRRGDRSDRRRARLRRLQTPHHRRRGATGGRGGRMDVDDPVDRDRHEWLRRRCRAARHAARPHSSLAVRARAQSSPSMRRRSPTTSSCSRRTTFATSPVRLPDRRRARPCGRRRAVCRRPCRGRRRRDRCGGRRRRSS